MNTQIYPIDSSPPDGPSDSAGSGLSLLAEVTLKWLMAGQGWWVDTARFHRDPSYAAGILRLAQASPTPELRECAAMIEAGIAGHAERAHARPG